MKVPLLVVNVPGINPRLPDTETNKIISIAE